jgi:hypothetical protein
MKNLLLSIIISLITSISFSQVTPEAFIGLLPAIPSNVCSMKKAERDKYLNYIDSLQQLIDMELKRRNSEIDANAEVFERQAKNNISKKYGLSQNDMAKLQNEGGMTEEEKNALINKALQNSANLSLDEIKNLKNMSKKERESWGEAYGEGKKAEIQADPKKNQEQQLQAKSLYELTAMQRHIIDSINVIETKFVDQFAQIDNDQEAKVILDNIQKWNKEASDLMGEADNAGMQRMTELNNKIKSEKEKYCSKYTPIYVDILRRYETYTKSSLPVWYRLESISTQQTKLQTGVEMKQEPGLVGIGKLPIILIYYTESSSIIY